MTNRESRERCKPLMTSSHGWWWWSVVDDDDDANVLGPFRCFGARSSVGRFRPKHKSKLSANVCRFWKWFYIYIFYSKNKGDRESLYDSRILQNTTLTLRVRLSISKITKIQTSNCILSIIIYIYNSYWLCTIHIGIFHII